MTSTDTSGPPCEVVTRDRVVIRFAGDSGDGMQLDRRPVHLRDRRRSATTCRRLPNFPAEIRAPAGTLPGVSVVPAALRQLRHPHPGDRPDVLVAMNPAALKANIADLPRGRRADRQHRRVHQAEPDQGRLRRLPARRRLARAVHRAPGRHGHADPRRPGGDRAVEEGRRAGEEHVRPGPAVLDVPPAHRGHRAVPAREVRQAPDLAEANVLAFRAGHAYGETTESFAVTYEVAPAQLPAGHLPADHRQHRAGLRDRRGGAGHRAAGVPRLVPDHPGLGHPARAVASTRRSASPPSRPRTRSPASVRRSARRSAARWASPPRRARGSR